MALPSRKATCTGDAERGFRLPIKNPADGVPSAGVFRRAPSPPRMPFASSRCLQLSRRAKIAGAPNDYDGRSRLAQLLTTPMPFGFSLHRRFNPRALSTHCSKVLKAQSGAPLLPGLLPERARAQRGGQVSPNQKKSEC